MIFIIDDDVPLVEALSRLVEEAGHRSMSFRDPREALRALESHDPELIVCNVALAGMTGHELHSQYRQSRGGYGAAFLFLSGPSEVNDIVKALDEGADDCVVKPVDPRVLAAKVEALIRRRRQGRPAVFLGDLSQLSLVEVLRFCEQRGLTGRVRFRGPEGGLEVPCRGGELVLDNGPDADLLAQLMEESDGTFIIESDPIEFADIECVRAASLPPPCQLPLAVTGRLSGVRAGGRLVQVQTEYEPPPVAQVVTLVMADGRVVSKRASPAPAHCDEEALGRYLEEQHRAVADTHQCIAEAMLRWQEKNYAEALRLMERAVALGSEDPMVASCMETIRRLSEQRP